MISKIRIRKHFKIISFVLFLVVATAHAQVETRRATSLQYTEQWKAIDKLMDGILPQSALPEIEKIQQAALKDKAYGHLIKAVITRNTCLQLTNENPQIAVINSLKKDAETTPFPAKAVIYSLTGEAYLNYYNQNRWNIFDRTALQEDAESDDIETWDATRLIREIVHYYRLSLKEPVLLQKTSIADFKEAIEGDISTRYLRPSLYDFLAHRAIDTYMNHDLWITDFSPARVIDHPAFFDDASGFVQITIPKTDTLAPTYLTLKLLQELTDFRLSQKDKNPLIDVNLKRYNYLKERGNYTDVDALYVDAMEQLIASCEGQKIWGKATYTLAVYYRQQTEEWSVLKTAKQRGQYMKNAVNLCREIEKHAPLKDDQKLATEMLKTMTQPDVSISIEKKLIPEKPALALVKYKNLHTAYLNIYRCNQEELDEWNSRMDLQNALHLLSKQKKIYSQILELPMQNDYIEHSFETKIDGLPVGSYLLIVSDDANPEKNKLAVLAFQSIQVTNIKLLQRNVPGKVEAYIVDASSGKPMPNVKISATQRIYDREQSKYTFIPKDTLWTDSCGIVLFSFGNRWDIRLHITLNEDEYTEEALNDFSRPIQSKNTLRTVFFTDRAIYRPGQTVFFKGLMYETDHDGQNSIISRTKTTVSFIDVNGKEITRQEFTTNEYGSFNGSFAIPQGLVNGQMTLRNEHGRITIRVEEYKRPTFEITMNPVTAGYVLGDSITISGTATALAGYPVDGAKVKFNVMRYQQFRPLRWMISPQRGSNRQIAAGIVYTDSKGQFSVGFPAKAEDIKPSDNGIYRYQITVDVTEVNGETQNNMQEINLSRTPLMVDWNPLPLPLAQDNGKNDSFEYPLKITNLNGNEIEANVQVELWTLKNPNRLLRHRIWQQPDTMVMSHDEFIALFPNDPYFTEDQPETFEKNIRLATMQINTPKDSKIDLSILQDAPTGWYFIRLKATGAQNTSIIDSAYIQLRQNDAPMMNMKDWLTVVKDSGEPGDIAVFRVAGENDSSLIRYDVLFKDKLVEQKWLTVGRIPQELRFPITENYRGGFAVAFAMVQDNRVYTALQNINVPYTNKELNIAFTSFRGRLLPGEKEKWTLTVKNKKNEREIAEMVATVYDASLDKFVKHDWRNYFYPNRSYWEFRWNQRFDPLSYSRDLIAKNYWHNISFRMEYERLKQENWGGMRIKTANMSMATRAEGIADDEEVLFAIVEDQVTVAGYGTVDKNETVGSLTKENTSITAIPLRTNFSETAFFYPELRTNDKGEILVEFTIPEALTRWNMLGFSHTKDFKTGNITNSLITQKQVAISANLPCFFRSGDTLILSAKVNNLTENNLNGNALLRLYDALTMQPVDVQMLKTNGTQPFTVKAGQSIAVKWTLVVPTTLQAVTYRLTAQAGNHTDGEERSVPVLSNRTLVTETMPFMVRGDQRRDLRFDRLANHQSATLQHHRVTLEYTSNPAWYAVQALPYLMEYPYECAEQVFTRFYANALATTVANSSPKIKRIFDQWRSLPDSKALLSNLEKNQDLKQALLEETPWLMQAASETERKKHVGLLFDFNRMSNEQKTALDKLKAMQGRNGGFPWFAGMPEDRFITQHIVTGLEHLRKLNALPRSEEINNLIEKAMVYCDARIAEDYKVVQQRAEERTARFGGGGGRTGAGERTGVRTGDDNRERERQLINSVQIHYLYACSFSRHYAADQQAFDFYMQQAERSWTRFNVYEQAMIALVMYRFGKPGVAQDILRSLKERAQMSNEMGMYWTDNRRGLFWNESPVETQAMLIQAFNEAGSDVRSVAEMKIWLLLNKQTNDWKTTKATSEAIYALLSTDEDLLGDNVQPLDIRIGGKPLKNMVKESIRPEAGTGNVQVSWQGNEINKNLASLRVTNPNSNIAWGAMYWQYFEDMDKISSAETNLQMSKQLFIRSLPTTPAQYHNFPFSKGGETKPGILEPITGSNLPKVGDVITVRLELRADRDFEYVHLKDMRAAGFEPVNTLSGYRTQGGLWYYESIKDASVNFFISQVRKGTYIFEYDLRVTHAGVFSNGITTLQCMYAPEFNAHSEGVRVLVE